jgi:addiction module HigA family antidote
MKTPITLGEILLKDYLVPMGISQNALARALGISPRSVYEIVLDRRSITPEMSLKLGKFFKQSAQFWFNIQTTCDFRQLRKKEKQITAAVAKDYKELAARKP